MTDSAPILRIDNPYTLEEAAQLPLLTPEEADKALDLARTGYEALTAMEASQRAALCAAAVEHMLGRADTIASDITRTMGKPLKQAQGELRGMAHRAEHMASIAEACLADTVLAPKPGYERRIERVALGVVLNLPAYNYPLLTAVNIVIPAILAGNAVVLKHSPRTALCGPHFADAFAAVGAAPGICQAIQCDHDLAGRLAADSRVNYVGFTGSVTGGRAVYGRVASDSFSDVGLELGGNDGAYVAADADVQSAARSLVDGACYNAGQSCCGVERVYVHESVAAEFVDACRDTMAKLSLGNPMDDVDMGPMAQPQAPALLNEHVADALSSGAQALLGGKPTTVDGKGRFFEPTLLVGVTQSMRVMQEESFGPLLPIMSVRDEAQALRAINDSQLGLTASIWTADAERARYLARQIETGTVFLNQCDVLDPALPWTGVKDSGKGSTLSTLGFDHLTRPRAINFKLP